MQKIKGNKFKLIYPKDAPGADPELYVKLLDKATQIWKAATGTYNPQTKPSHHKEKEEKDKEKPKKKKKKKPRVLIPKEEEVEVTVDGETATGDKEQSKSKSDIIIATKIKKGSATIGKDSWPPDDLIHQDEEAEQNERNEQTESNEQNLQREQSGKDEPVVEPIAQKRSVANDSYNFVEANKRRVSSNFYNSMQNTLGQTAIRD